MSTPETSNPEIQKFIESFCDAFKPDNADAVAGFFHYPMTMLADDMSLSLDSRADVEAAFDGVLESLKEDGFAYLEPQSLNIHKFSEDTAQVSAVYHRCKEDKSVMEEIGTTYTLIKQGKVWKLKIMLIHDTDTVLIGK